MPGARGVPIHSFRFVSRTEDQVLYAEPRRSCARNAVFAAVITPLSAFMLLHLGFTGPYPWVLGALRGVLEAESWRDRVASLIVLGVFTLWPLHVIFFAVVLIRGLVPRELHVHPVDRSVVLRKIPFLWRESERTFREGEVDSVELVLRRCRDDQDWAWLRLRLKNGRAVKLDNGRLTGELSQMASDIAAALGAPLARS